MSYLPKIIQIAAGPDGGLFSLDNAGVVYGFYKPFDSKPGEWLALPPLGGEPPKESPYEGEIHLGDRFVTRELKIEVVVVSIEHIENQPHITVQTKGIVPWTARMPEEEFRSGHTPKTL